MKINSGISRSSNHQIIKLVMLIITISHHQIAISQSYYPLNYFQSPMDTPLYLSAPFGSLRDNHFHSGMDIRTYEKEGLPVYAVADGYISRIKIAAVGYGKAIYIDHPNGYSSVYGHLQKYEGAIAEYIKRYQYEKESFDFDHFPGRDRLIVKKGQIIGWSGNSGGSTGPHLHFEIRKTSSEEPLNPQLFGIFGVDSLAPAIKNIIIYSLNGNRPTVINDLSVNPKKINKTDSGNYYTDTIEIAKGLTGFGVEAYDYMINSKQEYSLYRTELFIDEQKYFGYRLDRIDFENSKCINAHIDYEIYKRDQVRFQKCFLDDGNIIKIYDYLRKKGKYNIKDELAHKIRVNVYDIMGNRSSLIFYVRGFTDETLKNKLKPTCADAVFYPKKNNVFKATDLILEIPQRALYDTLDFCFEIKEKEKNSFSSTYKIHDQYTPLHKSFTISIKPSDVDDEIKDKLLIAYYTKERNIHSAGGEFRNGYVTARSSNFGNYFVTFDSVAPVIKPLNINKEGMVKDTLGLRIKIDDNLSGVTSYRATINGKWILMDYDAKNDLLLYEFDDKTIRGEKLDFILTVSDRKNNVSVYRKDIIIQTQ